MDPRVGQILITEEDPSASTSSACCYKREGAGIRQKTRKSRSSHQEAHAYKIASSAE